MRVLRQDPTLCRRLGRSTNPQRQQFSKIKTSTSSWLRRKRDYNYNPTRPSDCIEPQASHPDHVDHGPRRPRPEQLRRAPTTSTTSRAAPPSFDHVDHGPRRPRPEQLRRAPTTSTTRLRRNDDRHKERRYDNRDHSHDDRSKSSRTGQLHRQRHVKPSLEHRNTPTTPTGRQ